MRLPTRLTLLIGTRTLAAGLLTGTTTVTTPTAAHAASCTVSNLGWWSVKNQTCRSVRHFDVISGKRQVFGNTAMRGGTSRQGACWANVTRYGFAAFI